MSLIYLQITLTLAQIIEFIAKTNDKLNSLTLCNNKEPVTSMCKWLGNNHYATTTPTFRIRYAVSFNSLFQYIIIKARRALL